MASFQKRGKYWRYRIYYVDSLGKEKSFSKSGFRTKNEAKKAAIEAENKFNKGFKEEVTYTLKKWLDYYLETWRKNKISDNSFEIEQFSKKRILDFYNDVEIKAITPSMHQKFINDLIKKRL
ncbi:Arm DNA-binding domain-containing protein [Staphylococcus argenteus]|nr:Arm DNA-binding domain-containing protein [Staphylococcus argenteus]